MIAAAPAPARSSADDAWQLFAQLLAEESAALSRLNAAAVYLTQVLVNGSPQMILDADRQLGALRSAHAAASSKRLGMQARGFGKMNLQQVCAYTPRHMWPRFNQLMAELSYGAIALGITLNNNKSLIAAGLQRLVDMTAKLQESMTERTGIYRRRGYVSRSGGSVIVSSSV